MRSAILTTFFAALTLAAAAPQSTIPPPYTDAHPGGSLLLVSNITGQRPTEFRLPVDINRVTVIDPPKSAINDITQIKFQYFLNVETSKVECHAYLDEAGLEPFRVPFTKVKPLETVWKDKPTKVKSILCIVVV